MVQVKKNTAYILFLGCFFVDLVISSMSGPGRGTFALKAAGSLITFISVTFFLQTEQKKPLHFPKILFTLLCLWLCLAALSLTYSLNPIYGGYKLGNLLVSTFPFIVFSGIFFATLSQEKIKILASLIGAILFSLCLLVIAFKPFQYQSLYSFSLLNWSHVVLGRILGVGYIFGVTMVFKAKNHRDRLIYSLLLLLLIVANYITGLRAGLLGISIISLSYIPWLFVKTRDKSALLHVFSAIIIGIGAIVLQPESKATPHFERIAAITGNNATEDISIGVRKKIYELSLRMFSEKPFLGSGLGGYCRHYESEVTVTTRYSHNIFLEFGVELGLPGLFILGCMLWFIFSRAKYSAVQMATFSFALWLALFSKDMASNTLLWAGLGLLFLHGKNALSSMQSE
ncbi:MAG: O-antigen ligase family protein [Ignavibacteria bacterium]|nr:O-antigen ligase family protein [Ignavibacteria bacterium]